MIWIRSQLIMNLLERQILVLILIRRSGVLCNVTQIHFIEQTYVPQ